MTIEEERTRELEADLISSLRSIGFARVLVGNNIAEITVQPDAPPGVIEETARHWAGVSIVWSYGTAASLEAARKRRGE